MNDNELDFVLMELETANLAKEVYRYQTPWELSIVYYMVDFRKVFQGIFEPIYLHKDDVKSLGCEEEVLFNRIMGNTLLIMGIDYMKFSAYLRELRGDCSGVVDIQLINGLTRAMDEEDISRQILCITSSIRDRGAVGALSTGLLQRICEDQGTEKLLIGMGCNDYALVMHDLPKNAQIMEHLAYHTGNIRKYPPEIVQRAVLQYDSSKGILQRW